MNELAEPLIPKDFNKKNDSQPEPVKKSTEPLCEKCDLHFIRCLKPNDKKISDFFAHAMTL
jgi:myosin heavy subunit